MAPKWLLGTGLTGKDGHLTEGEMGPLSLGLSCRTPSGNLVLSWPRWVVKTHDGPLS